MFLSPFFCSGKGRMEDKKDWIGCGEVGRDRGKTRLGGGGRSMRHRRQVHAGIKPAWEGGGVCVA